MVASLPYCIPIPITPFFFYSTFSFIRLLVTIFTVLCVIDFQGESESGKAPWQGVCIYLSWMSSLLTNQVIDIHLLSIS